MSQKAFNEKDDNVNIVRSVTYIKNEVWKHVEKRDYNFTRYDKCDSKRAVNGRNRNTIDMIADGTKCRH